MYAIIKNAIICIEWYCLLLGCIDLAFISVMWMVKYCGIKGISSLGLVEPLIPFLETGWHRGQFVLVIAFEKLKLFSYKINNTIYMLNNFTTTFVMHWNDR